ncbi:hypothetical protein PUNSTDRAFT_136551 [Punctularia strigosozonata HHB-11173 SS5]|uniref:uncharacterized protein n=1 Tax=Punctularia strigosozonata (strain HHB-11173) TaxID=741275 RepID=UPI0004417195|nr:uncharacterized protein PUNSTDRAFT_136551 [Punctularia strigosozonata HHB-11173 SS5]EIN06714.1 hypothetical protein PUNSTDRAFT_136551 [Punctularia strigosozonata HHB-11173 SS5]
MARPLRDSPGHVNGLTSPGITPLRIAKRDGFSPPPGEALLSPKQPSSQKMHVSQLSRRQSNTYSRLTKGGLVSKSPFRSSIPVSSPAKTQTVGTRKVSGEKRPRPLSLQGQWENENGRPLGYKRRQSKGFQGLQEQEYVSKSPFRRSTSDASSTGSSEREQSQPPPVPPKAPTTPTKARPSRVPVPSLTPEGVPEAAGPSASRDTTIEQAHARLLAETASLSAPPSQSNGFLQPSPRSILASSPGSAGSPARSSLKSKRLLGPRDEGSRRERRKTVTWDERCDVVEFDRESSMEDPFFSDEEEDDYFGHDARPEEVGDDSMDVERSAEDDMGDEKASIEMGAEDSIVGLVDSMLQDAGEDREPRTPTHEHPDKGHMLMDEGIDNEDGVPYGRTHHADRAKAAHQQGYFDHPPPISSTPPLSTSPHTRSLTLTPPALASTPPNSNRRPNPELGPTSPGSHVPLGRTSHAERAREAHRRDIDDIENDVMQLPASPSPVKRSSTGSHIGGLVPRIGLPAISGMDNLAHAVASSVNIRSIGSVPSLSASSSQDPFGLPDMKSEPGADGSLSFKSESSVQEVAVKEEELESVDLNAASAHPRNSSHGRDQGSHVGHEDADKSSLSTNDEFHDAFAESHDESEAEHGQLNRSITSIGQSDVSISGFEAALGRTSTPPLSPPAPRSGSPFVRGGSPFARSGSPLIGRAASPLTRAEGEENLEGSLNGRRSPRISREDVHRRLLTRRSLESPLRELGQGEASTTGDSTAAQPGRTLPRLSNEAPATEPSSAETSVATGSDWRDATFERAERHHVSMRREDNYTYDGVMSIDPEPAPQDPPRPNVLRRAGTEVDMEGNKLQVVSSFEGLNIDFAKHGTEVESLGDMRSALDRLMEDVASSVDGAEGVLTSPGRHSKFATEMRGSGSGMRRSQAMWRMEAIVTEGVKPGRFEVPPDAEVDESMMTEMTEEPDNSNDTGRGSDHAGSLESADTERGLISSSFKTPPTSRPSSESPIPPPPPPKDAIRTREEMILEKRREARQREEDEAMGRATPPRVTYPQDDRPKQRRSTSTTDAEIVQTRAGKEVILDVPVDEADQLADTIAKELHKRDGTNQKYFVRERDTTIYASSDAGHGPQSDHAGSASNGRAWRTVRRPSDMNEYAKQIKEYRAQQGGKAHGKVFVKVVGVRNLNVPLPQQATAMSCTLNNGIHYVTTPECRLSRDCRIEQEFELIEHSKLEFTLTLKIRRDPHIIAQFKANAAPPPPPPVQQAPPPASKGGMRSFFSSPKKHKQVAQPPPPVAPVHRLEENLARYLKPDGTLARAFVSFKDIAQWCDTRVFEMSCPLIGQKIEAGNKVSTLQVGELALQIFRFPSLPGVPADQLPQSLDECLRGMRHVAWHKVTYFEGTLTQNGGDCTSWRRRQLRVIGANLVAFNDVTKRATATIDLRKAIAVEDDQARTSLLLSPASDPAARSRWVEEFDGPCGVERSFRLIFPAGEEIAFFADTDEEKAKWLELLRALVGRIPPNPLWAELLWLRQAELARQDTVSPSSSGYSARQ